MSPAPSAQNSIFVSHTNGDELAEHVLQKLLAAFARKPDEADSDLQLVCDRTSIAPGDPWRHRIYEWLEYCPAAVVLISPGSFLHDKPWVAKEAYYLSVRSLLRGNVVIVPVTIGDVAQKLSTEPDFKPAQISEIEWISCPDPYNEGALRPSSSRFARH
jgi:hypothetical protein